MRLIRISVPEEQQAPIVEIIREQDFGYTVTAGAGDKVDDVVITFLVPADAVEHVLADLAEVGFDKSTYTVSIDAEFANFGRVDEVQNRWGKTPNRLAPDALRSKAKDLRRNTRSYLWMMVLSAVVATAGLLLSSPAVVVGSMVIAPIVSPALTASVGAVRNDRDMFLSSIHMQALGLGVAIVTATVFGWLIKQIDAVPSALAIEQMGLIALRVSPSILAITVGLAAGAAGAYGLATKGDVTIVGVMIAAALIPTAGAIGIGLAWGRLVVAVGALLLLVLSMISVNLGGAFILWYLGYRPDSVDQSIFSYDTPYQGIVVAGTLLLILATAVIAGAAFYQQSSFERSVNDAVGDVLDQEEYEDLLVMSTSIEYRAPIVSDKTTVSVTLARTSAREFDELPNRLAQSISGQANQNVAVQVRFVDIEQSDGAAETLETTGSDRRIDAPIEKATWRGFVPPLTR